LPVSFVGDFARTLPMVNDMSAFTFAAARGARIRRGERGAPEEAPGKQPQREQFLVAGPYRPAARSPLSL